MLVDFFSCSSSRKENILNSGKLNDSDSKTSKMTQKFESLCDKSNNLGIPLILALPPASAQSDQSL